MTTIILQLEDDQYTILTRRRLISIAFKMYNLRLT